jgi:hypothetical protein
VALSRACRWRFGQRAASCRCRSRSASWGRVPAGWAAVAGPILAVMARPTREQQQVIAERRQRVIDLHTTGFSYAAIARAVSGQFGLEKYDSRRAHRDLLAGLDAQHELLAESREVEHAGALHERRIKAIERTAWGVFNEAQQRGDGWLALTATAILLDCVRDRIRGGDRDRKPLHPDPVKRRLYGLRSAP